MYKHDNRKMKKNASLTLALAGLTLGALWAKHTVKNFVRDLPNKTLDEDIIVNDKLPEDIVSVGAPEMSAAKEASFNKKYNQYRVKNAGNIYAFFKSLKPDFFRLKPGLLKSLKPKWLTWENVKAAPNRTARGLIGGGYEVGKYGVNRIRELDEQLGGYLHGTIGKGFRYLLASPFAAIGSAGKAARGVGRYLHRAALSFDPAAEQQLINRYAAEDAYRAAHPGLIDSLIGKASPVFNKWLKHGFSGGPATPVAPPAAAYMGNAPAYVTAPVYGNFSQAQLMNGTTMPPFANLIPGFSQNVINPYQQTKFSSYNKRHRVKAATINKWLNYYGMAKQANTMIPPFMLNNPAQGVPDPNAAANMQPGTVPMPNGSPTGMFSMPGPGDSGESYWGPRPVGQGLGKNIRWAGKGAWNALKANPLMGIFAATSVLSWPGAIANSYNAMAHPALNTGNYWQNIDA